jgi:hypothetical protein
MVVAALLSLLLPGLGHAYAQPLVRALVWFLGLVAVSLVLGSGEERRALALALYGAIAVLSALDVVLVMWLAGRPRRRA